MNTIKIQKSGFLYKKDNSIHFKEEPVTPNHNDFISFIDVQKDIFIKRFNQQNDNNLRKGFWLPFSNYVISNKRDVPRGYQIRVGDVLRFGMNLYKVRDLNSLFVPKNSLTSTALGGLRSPNNTIYNSKTTLLFPQNYKHVTTRNNETRIVKNGVIETIHHNSNNQLCNITNNSIHLSNKNLIMPKESKSSISFKQIFNAGNSSADSIQKLSRIESTDVNCKKVPFAEKDNFNKSSLQQTESNILSKSSEVSINANSFQKKIAFSNTVKELDNDITVTYCKICHLSENSSMNPLICPCNCIGKIRYIHMECLKKWYIARIKTVSFEHLSIITFPKYKCELCQCMVPEIIKIKNLLFSLIDFIKPGSFHYVILEKINWDSPEIIDENTVFYVLDMKKTKQITIGNDPNCDVTLCKGQSKTGIIEFIECNFYFRDLSSCSGQNFVFVQGDLMLLPNLPLTIKNNELTLTFLMKLRYIKKLFCYNNKKLSKMTYHDSFNYQKLFFLRKELMNIKNVELAKVKVNPTILQKQRTTDGSMDRYDKFKDELIVMNTDNCCSTESNLNMNRDRESRQIFYQTRTVSQNELNFKINGRSKFKKRKHIGSSLNIFKSAKNRVNTYETPKPKHSLFKKN